MHASAVLSQPDRRTVKKAEQIFSKLMKPNCLFNRHIREERSVSMERIGGAKNFGRLLCILTAYIPMERQAAGQPNLSRRSKGTFLCMENRF